MFVLEELRQRRGGIVHPADKCGVTGLEPTYGRASRYGVMTLSWTMNKIGLIGLTVEDCAIIFNAIFGSDGYDKLFLNLHFNWNAYQKLEKFRIGYTRSLFVQKKSYRDYNEKTLEMLKKFGIYEDTLIIVSADHGESQGELNVYGDHATACHIINRIPMIIKWPGKSWKKEENSLIYQADIAATILEGFNMEVPDSWDGKSFYQDLEKNEMKGRDHLIISQNAWSCQRTV